MADALHYSPQAQLDLDEILDYFEFEREDVAQGAKIVEGILAATERLPGRATRSPLVGPLPFIDDAYRFMRECVKNSAPTSQNLSPNSHEEK